MFHTSGMTSDGCHSHDQTKKKLIELSLLNKHCIWCLQAVNSLHLTSCLLLQPVIYCLAETDEGMKHWSRTWRGHHRWKILSKSNDFSGTFLCPCFEWLQLKQHLNVVDGDTSPGITVGLRPPLSTIN